MEHVSRFLNKSPLEVRQPHLYREGDVTHFGMVSGSQQRSIRSWEPQQVGLTAECMVCAVWSHR
jgi:hypothetical protein